MDASIADILILALCWIQVLADSRIITVSVTCFGRLCPSVRVTQRAGRRTDTIFGEYASYQSYMWRCSQEHCFHHCKSKQRVSKLGVCLTIKSLLRSLTSLSSIQRDTCFNKIWRFAVRISNACWSSTTDATNQQWPTKYGDWGRASAGQRRSLFSPATDTSVYLCLWRGLKHTYKHAYLYTYYIFYWGSCAREDAQHRRAITKPKDKKRKSFKCEIFILEKKISGIDNT